MEYKGLLVVKPEYDPIEEESLVQCPHCDAWEIAPSDIPRRKLNFPVLHWEGENKEISVTRCFGCKKMFKIDWN